MLAKKKNERFSLFISIYFSCRQSKNKFSLF